MRRLIAGNWKMNGLRAALDELAAIAAAADAARHVNVALFPPFTLLAAARAEAPGLAIGGQDCAAAAKGPHTGCVSADMLGDAGATMVIVGHSERRLDQGESDALVRAKAEAAMAAGLVPIVCVGEGQADHDDGGAAMVIAAQLDASLPAAATAATLVVAYEPIWSIGTGRTPTPDELGAMHGLIRAKLIERFDAEGAGMRILYGGSVNGANAAALLAVADVDGALVGGASLTAAQFVPIIRAAAA